LKSSLKSVEDAERNSSRTEYPLPLPPLELELESQDDEKMEGPKAFESPSPLSKVSEPDLNLLCRSVVVVAVVEEAEVEEVEGSARGGVPVVDE
jgi:hypothetical protein